MFDCWFLSRDADVRSFVPTMTGEKMEGYIYRDVGGDMLYVHPITSNLLHLHVQGPNEISALTYEETGNLIAWLEAWRAENKPKPKPKVKQNVELFQVQEGEWFTLYGLKWQRGPNAPFDPEGYCRCLCSEVVEGGQLHHILWAYTDVEVMR